jgi:hypothetical protein
MYGSSQSSTRSGSSRGPAIYFGYCGRSGQYRMMDLPEYMSSMQDGMSRLMNDTASLYQGALQTYADRGQEGHGRTAGDRGCGCKERQCDCHCECCVCDADVLVHARCGEVRRIPVTFENDTRRDKPVKLELGKFVTAGGRELGWAAALSDTEFTLRSCGEQTVTLAVAVRCDRGLDQQPNEQPDAPADAGDNQSAVIGNRTRFGSVDRCEVGYATIRAEGCLTRPVVIAVAVLPDDCDAYRHPCGCGCCH